MADAEAGVAAALTAAAEAVNAAEDTPRENESLEAYVAQFDEGDLEAAIEAAENEVAAATLAVEGAEGNLATARGVTVTDGAAALTGAVAAADNATNVDSNGDIYTLAVDLGLTGANRLTDANIAKAVTEAQKAVNADKTQYLETGALADAAQVNDAAIDTFSAKALQTAAINAESALNADVSANGSNEELLGDVRSAISAFVNAGGDLNTELQDPADVSLGGLLVSINQALAPNADAAAREAGIDGLVDSFGTTDATTGEYEPAFTELDENVSDFAGIISAIEAAEARDELTEVSAAADANFEATLSGAVLKAAQDLQTGRDVLNNAVDSAEQELTEAQDLVSTLETLQADYDAAVTDLEAAQQYFTDNDLELPVTIEGGVTATAENDIFLFTGEEGTVSGFGLEGDDQLFVGTGFTWTPLEAGDDLATQRLGDSGALEIFAQQSGNNVVLSFESEAFAGNAVNTDDIVEVTLTGVSLENLSLSADGFITVA